uniref:Uncharacterized protein n=1 Tax=Siphoviridae sp. ctZHD14 TaxID=2827891 RepID=A0A8S5SWA3_9CAUD|nr:MAG TPA: hypothetical protein [Siphoviridae sp. ctZHD14]
MQESEFYSFFYGEFILSLTLHTYCITHNITNKNFYVSKKIL